MKKLLAFAILMATSFGVLNAASYSVDTAHSSVGFKIKHLSVSNVAGSFTKFNGQIELENKLPKAIEASIDVASVNTGDKDRDNHLLQNDFFGAQNFPQMKFVMKEFKDGKVIGDLTIRDVTKPISLDYEFGGEGKNFQGKDIVGFSLEGKISRKDFSFAPSSKELILGDEIKLNIEIEAFIK